MHLQLAIVIIIFGSVSSCIVAALRNRSPLEWLVLGGLMPLLSLAMLGTLERLGVDGKPVAVCCPHCPCRGQVSAA